MSKTNPIPQLGESIGGFVVIDATPVDHKSYKSKCYLMECILCGERKYRPAYEIYANKACGSCHKKDVEFVGKYMSNIRYRAKKKDLQVDIDDEYLHELFKKQQGRCALSGIDLKLRTDSKSFDFTASLDRIDSSQGYIQGNVQWVHKWINKMKLDLPQERFLEMCQLVVQKNIIFGTRIIAELKVEGMHRWRNCPIEEVAYLRDYHRHMFHIRVTKWVNHDDRDVEFIQLSHSIRQYLRERYFVSTFNCLHLGDRSCEMIANELVERFDLQSAEVLEDGEGGAIVTSL